MSLKLHPSYVTDIQSIGLSGESLSDLWIKSNIPMYSDSECLLIVENPCSMEVINIADLRFKDRPTITIIDKHGNELYVDEAMAIDELFGATPTSAMGIMWNDILNKPTSFNPITHNHTWAQITSGKPTTIAGYGITDAFTQTLADARYPQLSIQYTNPTWLAGIDATTIKTGTIDLARLPAFPSANTVVCTTIPAMSASDQLLVAKGTVVIESTTGNTYRYSGAGSVILNASYIQQSDMTPDWAVITNRPTNVSYWSNDAGYLTAASSLAWAKLTGVPSTFSPSAHTHLWADITDKPTSFAPSAHVHAIADTTGLQAALDAKQSTGDYATNTALTNGLVTKSDTSHTHTFASLTSKPTTLVGYGITDAATSGHNHNTAYLGINSNAVSATKLATARTIAGVSFDGTANISIPYANLTGLPTLGTLAAKSTVTWTSDLTGVPSGLSQISQPGTHGNIKLGSTIVGGWHGIEFSDAQTTRILINDVAGGNICGFYDATNGWLMSFNRSKQLVDGWVPWAKLQNVPSTFTPSAHTHLWAHITDKPTASTSTSGVLTSTDWNTFNNKASTTQLANYLPLSGGTMSGAITFANGIWNTVGDDIAIGDINEGATLGLTGRTGGAGSYLRFCAYNQADGVGAGTGVRIGFDGSAFRVEGILKASQNGLFAVGDYLGNTALNEWVWFGYNGIHTSSNRYAGFMASKNGDVIASARYNKLGYLNAENSLNVSDNVASWNIDRFHVYKNLTVAGNLTVTGEINGTYLSDLAWGNVINDNTDMNTPESSGVGRSSIGTWTTGTNSPFGNYWYNVINVRHRNGGGDGAGGWGGQLVWGMTAAQNRLAFRSRNSGTTWQSWYEVWTNSNLVDPAKLSANNTFTGVNTFSDQVHYASTKGIKFDNTTTGPLEFKKSSEYGNWEWYLSGGLFSYIDRTSSAWWFSGLNAQTAGIANLTISSEFITPKVRFSGITYIAIGSTTVLPVLSVGQVVMIIGNTGGQTSYKPLTSASQRCEYRLLTGARTFAAAGGNAVNLDMNGAVAFLVGIDANTCQIIC